MWFRRGVVGRTPSSRRRIGKGSVGPPTQFNFSLLEMTTLRDPDALTVSGLQDLLIE
jgi:hypothetical protein